MKAKLNQENYIMKTHKINRAAEVLADRLFLALSLVCLIVTNTAMAENIKVKMDTNKGSVIIELYPEKAPETVKNFLHYVNEGKYNNTIFHRVVKGFLPSLVLFPDTAR
jgi:hypothetical protein